MARERFDKYFVQPSGIDNRTGMQTADLTIFNGNRLTGVPTATAHDIYRLNQSILSSGLKIGDSFEAQIPRKSIDTKTHKIRSTTWVPTPDRSVTFGGIGPDGIIVNDPSAEGGSRLLDINMKDILTLRKMHSGLTPAQTETAESQPPNEDEKLIRARVEMSRHPTPHFINVPTPKGIVESMIAISAKSDTGEEIEYVFDTNKKMEGSGDSERELLEARLKRWRSLGLDVIIGPGIDPNRQEGDEVKTIKQDGVFGLYVNIKQIAKLREERHRRHVIKHFIP